MPMMQRLLPKQMNRVFHYIHPGRVGRKVDKRHLDEQTRLGGQSLKVGVHFGLMRRVPIQQNRGLFIAFLLQNTGYIHQISPHQV